MRAARAFAYLLGLGLVGFGALTIFTATAGFFVAGFDNEIDTGATRIESASAAVATATGDLGGDWITNWPTNDQEDYRLRVAANGRGTKDLFVGVAPTDQVQGFLGSGPAWDELDSFSSRPFQKLGHVTLEPAGGGEPGPLPAPGGQVFWIATVAPADTVELSWDFEPGEHTVVLMNADGSPGIDSDTTVELVIPKLNSALLTAIVFGAGLALAGVLVMRRARRSYDWDD